MGAIGGHNPCAFHVGGGQSSTESAYLALRSAIGRTSKGGEVAGPPGGLEDTWRLAKAIALAKVSHALPELAIMQAFPDRATEHLTVYEKVLALAAAGCNQERRAAATVAYTQTVSAIIPQVRASLRDMHPDLDVVVQAYEDIVVSHSGKALANRLGDTYNDSGAALLPNYSGHFVVVVMWSGGGIPTPSLLTQIRRYLNRTLPSWVDFKIINRNGFYLDGHNDSFLDLTAL